MAVGLVLAGSMEGQVGEGVVDDYVPGSAITAERRGGQMG